MVPLLGYFNTLIFTWKQMLELLLPLLLLIG